MLLRNILIFHSGALGDFVQTWPLGLALGRLYPQSRVVYVTQRQKGLLAEKAMRLEFADVESGWHHLFGDAARLPEICRNKLASAHSIFTFMAKPGDPWMNAVASIAPQGAGNGDRRRALASDSGIRGSVADRAGGDEPDAWLPLRTGESEL